MLTSLNLFGSFKDPSLQHEFLLYCMKQRSKFTFAITTVLILSWSVVESIVSTWLTDDYQGSEKVVNEFYGIISLVCAGIAFVLWAIVCFSLLNVKNPLIYSYCQVALIATVNLLFLLKMAKVAQLGLPQCIPSDFKKFIIQILSYSSSPEINTAIQSALPPDCHLPQSYKSISDFGSVLGMVFSFELWTVICVEPRVYVVWTCHFLITAFMINVVYNYFFAMIPLTTYLLTAALLFGEVHFQRVRSFLDQKKIQELLEENERNADANHAMEMRHMIGNVAHDLKTVSTTK